MKYLCPACERLVELEQFRLEGTALLVTCPSCRVESSAQRQAPVPPPAVTPSGGRPATPRTAQGLASSPLASNVVELRNPLGEALASAARAAAEDPFTPPPGFCPKCVAPRTEAALDCPACGLTFARFDAATLAVPTWLEERWRALLASWGDGAAHQALQAVARAEGELVALGRLYRVRLAFQPDDPLARAGRDEVVALASAVALPGSEPPPATSPFGVALSFVFLVLCAAAAVWMLRASVSWPR